MRNNCDVNKQFWEIGICCWIAKWEYDPEKSIDYSRFVQNAWYGLINNANVTWMDPLFFIIIIIIRNNPQCQLDHRFRCTSCNWRNWHFFVREFFLSVSGFRTSNLILIFHQISNIDLRNIFSSEILQSQIDIWIGKKLLTWLLWRFGTKRLERGEKSQNGKSATYVDKF